MKSFVTIILFLLVFSTAVSFSSDFTINGIPYNSMEILVYPNTTNTFVIERSAGFLGSAEIDNSNFSISDQAHFIEAQAGSDLNETTLVFLDQKKLTVFITPKAGSPLSSKGTVSIFPYLRSDNQAPIAKFTIKLALEPEIQGIELLTSDLNDIKSGKAFRIKIKGSQLKDILIKLDDKINAKVIENNGKEMIVEYKLSGKFNGFKLNQNSFGLLQDRIKLKFKAKDIFVK